MTTRRARFGRQGWHGVGALGAAVMLVVMCAASLATSGTPWRGVGLWFAGCAVSLPATFLLVRRHPSPAWWLAWPLYAMSTVWTFGLVDPAAATLMGGLLTLTMLFTGLTQPPGRSLYLIPPTLVVLWTILDMDFAPALIRVLIAAVTLTAVCELPSRLLWRLAREQHALAKVGQLDPLTGALNRQTLPDVLDRLTGRAFLVMIDLDHFKAHNDAFGHLAGDTVLVDFAAMLRAGSRSTDHIIRYGGEEFLVVLDVVDPSIARGAVNRWVAAWRSHDSKLTFSAGITDLDGPAALGRADVALYQAKAAGRDRRVMVLSTDTADSPG